MERQTENYKVGDTIFYYNQHEVITEGVVAEVTQRNGYKINYYSDYFDEDLYNSPQACVDAGSQSGRLLKACTMRAAADLCHALDCPIDELDPGRLWDLTLLLFKFRLRNEGK